MTIQHSTGLSRPPSVRTLSELARSGYNLLRQPFTEVAFEVHHVADRPGQLLALLQREKHPSSFLETMTSGANGAGLVVGTRLGDMPASQRYRDQGSGSDPSVQFSSDESGFHFRGVARPNLTFLYESAHRLEGIIAIADEPKAATMSRALVVKDVIAEITGVASELGEAPLLSVQSPVQRPVESNVEPAGNRKLPPSSSLSVRFSIALDRPSVELRIKLVGRLEQYCEEHGYRMWLADSRPGHQVGNWFGIRARANSDEKLHTGWVSGFTERISHVFPVTFVGPARVGSTHAIVSYLQQFEQVGIIGCSITALDDLAFVHLQLAFPESVASGRVFPHSKLAHSGGETPLDHFGKLLTHFLGKEPNADNDRAANLLAKAGDYQTLAGPMLRYTPTRKERRMALWVSWQMTRHAEGIVTPIDALLSAWNTLLRENRSLPADTHIEPTVEYLICRDVGNSVLRGKGKISVPYRLVLDMFPQQSVESPPSRLCVGLEDAWKSHLDSSKMGANVLGVTVAWREYWLGHWSALA